MSVAAAWLPTRSTVTCCYQEYDSWLLHCSPLLQYHRMTKNNIYSLNFIFIRPNSFYQDIIPLSTFYHLIKKVCITTTQEILHCHWMERNYMISALSISKCINSQILLQKKKLLQNFVLDFIIFFFNNQQNF